ncbi:hypothetical protein [Clostridium sp. 'White wine YQ']|uniref:hypothetical protein n=1 Tax=Clostridium sp. 'White wine YQ' TaxID=3027474 RepID=UPI0023662BAE|nr:hypothetical protein [Clostridium sp. 'White wine YQ']MDD7793619.1 hypothetical protein [Clostridium sp. 'White wine YQ']
MSCLCIPKRNIKCKPLKICVEECACKCCGCLPGLRATLGYLYNLGATNIRVESIAPGPLFNADVSITRFYPDATDSSTATLVEFSNGVIVSICNIETIQSDSLIDNSADRIPDQLKQLLDASIREIPETCVNSCENQLRLVFEAHIGQQARDIDTHSNSRIALGTVRGTGAGVALLSLPNNTTGVVVNLCFVGDVTFGAQP